MPSDTRAKSVISRKTSKRRGAVLLMTLLLITILSGGIALLISHSDHLLRLSQRPLGDAQTGKIAGDLKRLLPTLLSKIDSARTLEYALILPLSSRSEDGRFALEASLRSPLGRFNINNVCDPSGTPRKPYDAFLPALFARYPIASPEVFINIVYDTIDTDLAERQPGSEIVTFFSDFHNGSIEDKHQFNQIVARYLALTKDPQVLQVPWDRVIGFEGEKIDINYASSEVVSLIVPEIDANTLSSITEMRTEPFEGKEKLTSLAPALSPHYDAWFTTYKAGSSYPLVGEVTMRRNGEESMFVFHVDAKTRILNRLEIVQ